MKIEILEAGGFGKFVNRSFKFGPGLNLIHGHNEAGKSTMVALIEMLLYGAKKEGITVKKFNDQHEKYVPWDSERYDGNMLFCLDDGRKLEVSRSFSKNKEQFALFDLNIGKDVSADFSVDKRGEVLFAKKLFKMSKSVFLNTVMISQMDITRGFGENTEELTADLLKSISGTSKDNSTAKALSLLDSALNRIGKTGRGKRSGELAAIITQLEEELKLGRERRIALSQRQERLKELENREEILSSGVENIESSQALTSIKELKATIEKAKQLENKILEDEKVLEDYKDFASFPLESYPIASQQEELKKEKKNQYEKMANKLEDLDSENDKIKAKLQELNQYRSLPENAAEEIIELKTSWQQAEKNIVDVRGQVESEIDKTRVKQERLSELEKLFAALGENSGDSLQKLSVEEDELETRMADFSQEIGDSSTRKEKLKSSALNLAIIVFFTSLSGALLSLAALMNVHFPFYIPVIFSVISACLIYPSLSRQKQSRNLAEEITSTEDEYKRLASRHKDIRKERATFFSLAGVGDTSGFLKLEAEYNGLKELLSDNAVLIQQKRLPKMEADILEIKDKILLRLSYVGLGGKTNSIIERDILTFRENIKIKDELEVSLQNLRKQKEELIAELKQLEVDIESVRGQLRNIYDSASCANLTDFARAKENKVAWNGAEKLLVSHRKSLEYLLNNKPLEEYEIELKTLTKMFGENAGIEHKDKFDRNDLKQAQKKLEDVKNEIGPLKGEISEMLRENRDIGIVEAELQEARGEYRTIDQRREALKLAIEGINGASEKLHADFAPVLNQSISGMISKVSIGKYNEAMVGDDFHISLREQESRKIVSVNSLSSGARDQVFFASRIALADAITHNSEKMPLFLDDTFVEYDLDRLQNTLELVKELTGERQILMFTCHSREIKLASEIFGTDHNIINMQD